MPNQLTKTDHQIDYILLDCSSSMLDKWHDSIGAIDAYIAGLKAEHVTSDVIFHMFYSANVDYVHRNCPVADWIPLIESCPGPDGLTPLYDAVNCMGRRLRELDPPRAHIVIVTDGDNNASGTNVHQARAILDWCKAKGWDVTFIGADFSNSKQARLLGATDDTAIGVQKRLLTDAAKNLARKRGNHFRTGAPMHWSKEEQQQFGGYLAGPGK